MYAAFILDEILSWQKEEWKGAAVQLAKGLPVELRAQGLMVTIARLWHKDEKYTRRAAELLGEWITELAPGTPWRDKVSGKAAAHRLFNLCQKADRRCYMWAQREAVALAELLKILADAFYGNAEDRDISIKEFPTFDGKTKNNSDLMAGFVLGRVLKWSRGSFASDAATKAKALPVEISSSGVLVALANLIRRSKDEAQEELAKIMAGWIAKISPVSLVPIESEQEKLFETVLKGCIRCDRATYQAIEAQALKIAIFIKAYATALYDSPE